MKKLIALLMVLCLSFTMLAGCGSKDEEEDKKPKIVKGDMFDMLEAMANTKSGVTKADFDMSYDGQSIKGSITCAMDSEKQLGSFGFNVSLDVAGKKIDVAIDNICVVADNNLYLNLKGIAEAGLKVLSSAGSDDMVKSISDSIDLSKLGWFKFPLPDDLPKGDENFQKKCIDSMVGLFENMLKNTKMDGEDGDYTATLKTKEDYAQVVTAIRDFFKADFKGLAESAVNSTKNMKFDVNKYFDKLVSEYKNDILEVGKAYGLTEEYVDQMIQSVKGQDLNKMLDQYREQAEGASSEIISDEEINKLATELDGVIDKIKNFEGEVPLESVIRVSADKDGYTADLKMNAEDKDSSKKMSLSIKFSVEPGDCGVKAPSDLMSVKQIADIATPFLTMVNVNKPTPTDGPKPIDTPTPTQAPIDTPTPEPTDAPVDTPTPEPTDAPADTPTPEPTAEPTQAPTGDVATKFENGQAVIALGNGKALYCNIAGDWEPVTTENNALVLMQGYTDVLSMTTTYIGALSDEQFKSQIGMVYKVLSDYGDWMIVEAMEGVAAGVLKCDDYLFVATNLGDEAATKALVDKITNISIK